MSNVQEEWNEKCRAAALERQQCDYENCRLEQENQAAETSALYQRYKEDKRKKEAERAATNVNEVWPQETLSINEQRHMTAKFQTQRGHPSTNPVTVKSDVSANPNIHNIGNVLPEVQLFSYNNSAIHMDMLRNYYLPMMSANDYNYAMAQGGNLPFNPALINAMQMNKMNQNMQHNTANAKLSQNNQLQQQILMNQQVMAAQNFNALPKNVGYCTNPFPVATMSDGQNFQASVLPDATYPGFAPPQGK